MEFLSACYLQQGKNAVSLLLQQYCCRQSQVLLGCVCVGEGADAARAGGYMAEQVLQWFRGLPLKKLSRNQERAMGNLEEALCVTLRRIDCGLEYSMAAGGRRAGFAGVLCIGDRYLLLRRGAGRICLINRAFDRVHIRWFGGDPAEESYMERGILQPGLCLLSASEGFFDHVTERMIGEGLSVSEFETEKQMDRHLKELAGEGERRGGSNMGAVLMRTC